MLVVSVLEKILVKIDNRSSVTVSELLKYLDQSLGLGIFLVIFSMIPALPLPALYIATFLSLPVFVILFHILLGKQTLWLPNWFLQRSISKSIIEKFVKLSIALISKFSRIYKTRWTWVLDGSVIRIVALLGIIINISVLLPIPFSNTIPSVGILLIGLGIMEKDGLFVIAGVSLGIIGIAVAITVYYGFFEILSLLF